MLRMSPMSPDLRGVLLFVGRGAARRGAVGVVEAGCRCFLFGECGAEVVTVVQGRCHVGSGGEVAVGSGAEPLVARACNLQAIAGALERTVRHRDGVHDVRYDSMRVVADPAGCLFANLCK